MLTRSLIPQVQTMMAQTSPPPGTVGPVQRRVRRPRLGSVVNKGFDAEGYERRERLVAIGECDHCGKRIEMWESTVEWVQGRDKRWKHNAYDGLAIGFCCGSMYADDWDGCRRFDPETPNH